MTTVAGPAEGSSVGGNDNGTLGDLSTARFNRPVDVIADTNNNLFVSDLNNHCIRKIDLTLNQVSTFSGLCGTAGDADGLAANVRFNRPEGLAFDSLGNLYVADSSNRKIKKLDSNGDSVTYAGTGARGNIDGPTSLANFGLPTALALDDLDNLYIADRENHSIRKVDAVNQNVSTYVGGSGSGFADGDKDSAKFNQPHDLVVANNGDIYVADRYNHRIRRINSQQQVDTIAGTTNKGFLDSDSETALFDQVVSLTINGNELIISDFINNRLRKFDLTNVSASLTPSENGIFYDENLYVSTYAGTNAGFKNGFRKSAEFNNLTGLAKDSNGNIYIADISNHRIRVIDKDGNVSTFAGIGVAGNTDGDALTTAQFNAPSDVAIAPNGDLYVADRNNNSIRKISGSVVTEVISGLNRPQGLTFDNNGNLLISNTNSHKILIYDGITLSDFAGTGSSGYFDGAKLTRARFRNPVGLVVDKNNNVYVADTGNHLIRKISGSLVETYSGIAGNASFLDGDINIASFSRPLYLDLDSSNNLLVTDSGNNRIRLISKSDLKVYTLAGNGVNAFVDASVKEASIGQLGAVLALDDGTLVFADTSVDRLRMVSDLSAFNENLGIPDPEPVETEKEIFIPVIQDTAPIIDLLNAINFDSNKQFAVLQGTSVTLRAFIFDAQDSVADLEPSLVWTSSLDGELARANRNFNISSLSLGLHDIQISVRDSAGQIGTYEFKINVVESPEPGTDLQSGDISLSFNNTANVINIRAPRKLKFSKRNKKKLRVSALQLNTIDSVASLIDDLSDTVVWEYIDFSDKDNPDITARTFLKVGSACNFRTLPEGTHAVFARIGEVEDYIKVTVKKRKVIIEPVTVSQNLKLFKL